MGITIVSTQDFQLLSDLDKRMFNDADAFEPDDFYDYVCFLVFLNEKLIGSLVLGEHRTVGLNFKDKEPIELGTLYIISMGVVPEYQGCDIGKFEENWEIEYARTHGFRKVVTNARKSNQRIINLNNKFGFIPTRIIPNYYDDGEDSLVMELAL